MNQIHGKLGQPNGWIQSSWVEITNDRNMINCVRSWFHNLVKYCVNKTSMCDGRFNKTFNHRQNKSNSPQKCTLIKHLAYVFLSFFLLINPVGMLLVIKKSYNNCYVQNSNNNFDGHLPITCVPETYWVNRAETACAVSIAMGFHTNLMCLD